MLFEYQGLWEKSRSPFYIIVTQGLTNPTRRSRINVLVEKPESKIGNGDETYSGTGEPVKQIISVTSCEKNFECYEGGFEKVTEVRIVAGSLIECMDTSQPYCSKGLLFGTSSRFCKCPLRAYAARELR